MFGSANKVLLMASCLLFLNTTGNAQAGATAKNRNASAQPAAAETDRMRDGLTGPVRRVRTEVAKLTTLDGHPVESKHVILEIVAYDVRGNKIENQYFPIVGSTLTGKEVYKYDDKGNISEMTLLNPDGSLLSKENYRYEFDFAGNWNKMTTSVAVVDGGRITFEPTEVTYRSIMYYLDENMAKMMTPTATPSSTATVPPTNAVPEKLAVKTAETRNSKQSPLALPAVSTTSVRSTPSGPEEKTLMTTNPEAPRVMLDEAPPTPEPKPILKPVSGGVLNGTAITLPAPIYPEAAKRMRTGGVVEVDVVLDEMGKVVSAVAKSGPAIFREAAVNAALRARFSPTKLSGQPVKVSGIINYRFALAQQ